MDDIEWKQLIWYGHVQKMVENRLVMETSNGIFGKMKERKIKNNVGDGNTENDKREEQARIAIKDRSMAQDILIRNNIYILI